VKFICLITLFSLLLVYGCSDENPLESENAKYKEMIAEKDSEVSVLEQ